MIPGLTLKKLAKFPRIPFPPPTQVVPDKRKKDLERLELDEELARMIEEDLEWEKETQE